MGGSFHVKWESEEEWWVLLITREGWGEGNSFHMCIFWQAWRKGRSRVLDAGIIFFGEREVHPRWYDSDRSQ